MATRGVFQLTKLYINYCEHGGSSQALREYISNGKLVAWATAHPHVEIAVNRRNGKHPFVEADYLTNSKKTSCHQISVKNYEKWKHVEEVLDLLSNRSGRKITKITKPVLTDTPTIQGVWTPFLNLQMQQEPAFRVSILEELSTNGGGETSGDAEKVTENLQN